MSTYSKRSRTKSKALLADKNRIFVEVSNQHFTLKVITPLGAVLTEFSTRQKAIAKDLKSTSNKEAAHAVGLALGEWIVKNKIDNLAYDRGGLQYVGKVKAAAEGLRSVKVRI
ncbi:uL18 family ribosomal protein [Gammaproteobacteria bacterium]|nr:uL18 family ribosomal protein [Gammaproteobacteria bacterium]